MKTTIRILSLALLLSLSTWAQSDPAIPWAQPQYFSDFKNERFNFPRFEAVVEGKVLKQGEKGEAVERLQKALIDLGFALPGGADGQYGGQTVAAVNAFQSSRGFKTTGIVDRITVNELDRVSPQPGKKVWEDSSAANLALQQAPVIAEKKARVLIDLSERRLTVYDKEGLAQRVFPISIGAKETPTAPGVKVVYDKLADPRALAEKLWPESKGAAFGTRLIDFSWYDPNKGSQAVSDEELHGTFIRESIGQSESHGCMRMYNEDIEWMYQNLQIGDLVLVQK